MVEPYTNARSEHKKVEPLPTTREHLQGGRTKGETLQETEKQKLNGNKRRPQQDLIKRRVRERM